MTAQRVLHDGWMCANGCPIFGQCLRNACVMIAQRSLADAHVPMVKIACRLCVRCVRDRNGKLVKISRGVCQ
eukprot:11170977-Lingulodinium_polyedra.AAC.1